MKTPSETHTELRNLTDLLVQSDIAVDSNPVILMRSPGGRCRISWPDTRVAGEPFARGYFGSLQSYREWIAARAYSCVLYDGALIQLSYDYSGDELVGHRLLYNPCPFEMDTSLLREEPVLDVIDMYAERVDAHVRVRSPLRFDYDIYAQSEDHPAAHLTLYSDSCRLPVVRPLSPGHFIRFLFRRLYPSLWSSFEFIRKWPQESGDRTITLAEECELHISCRRLGVNSYGDH